MPFLQTQSHVAAKAEAVPDSSVGTTLAGKPLAPDPPNWGVIEIFLFAFRHTQKNSLTPFT